MRSMQYQDLAIISLHFGVPQLSLFWLLFMPIYLLLLGLTTITLLYSVLHGFMPIGLMANEVDNCSGLVSVLLQNEIIL
jgi:hypothetical protein